MCKAEELVGSCTNQIKSKLINTYQIILGFEERGKPGYLDKNLSDNQQTQPTYDIGSGNRTWATLVGGKCSHHDAISAALNLGIIIV